VIDYRPLVQVVEARILKELIIKDKRLSSREQELKGYSTFRAQQIRRKTGEELTDVSGANFLEILIQVTPLNNVNLPNPGNISFRHTPTSGIYNRIAIGGQALPALFILNGNSYGYDYHNLDWLRTEQLNSVEVIKGSYATLYYGSDALGGAILIETVDGVIGPKSKIDEERDKFVILHQVNVAKQFYSPKYSSPPDQREIILEPDLRTTLYWNDYIVSDMDGHASVSFFTGDRDGVYVGILEGVGLDGKIGRKTFTIHVVRNYGNLGN